MNDFKIKVLANNLEEILIKLSILDTEVEQLYEALKSLIRSAQNREIDTPVDYVPGKHWFFEGNLAKYNDLESAYAKFSIAITMTNHQITEYEEFKKQFLTNRLR